MGTIQIRIDNETKQKAQKVLHTLGVDMSSAIKMFLNQVIIQEKIPFTLLTKNGFTHEQEQEILRISKEVEQGINCTPPLEWEETLALLKLTDEEMDAYFDRLHKHHEQHHHTNKQNLSQTT